MWIAWQRQRSDCQQDSQLGRSKAEVRHAEYAGRVGGQIRFSANEQVGGEQGQRHERIYQARQRHPCKQERRPREIDDVIDVIAVSWTFAAPDARDGSVQTVAKPVENEKEIHQPQRAWVPRGKRVADTRSELRNKSQGGQVV